MNEIDKLKIEHARYKEALENIKCGVYNTEPSAIADAALNPPPPVPVTLEDLLAALRKLNRTKGNVVFHSIRFFGDGSGYLYAEGDVFHASFFTLRGALDKINERSEL